MIPTKPGFYWFIQGGKADPCEVDKKGVTRFIGTDDPRYVERNIAMLGYKYEFEFVPLVPPDHSKIKKDAK